MRPNHSGVQIDETTSVAHPASFCFVAVHPWDCLRAVESPEPCALRAAGTRRSATDAANRSAETASVLGLHHPSALFARRGISITSGIRGDQRQLAGNEVGNAIFRRR